MHPDSYIPNKQLSHERKRRKAATKHKNAGYRTWKFFYTSIKEVELYYVLPIEYYTETFSREVHSGHAYSISIGDESGKARQVKEDIIMDNHIQK